MAIKRNVTVVCDGPCGVTISSASVPESWRYVTFSAPDGNGDKRTLHLCPSCAEAARVLLVKEHFAFGRAEVAR